MDDRSPLADITELRNQKGRRCEARDDSSAKDSDKELIKFQDDEPLNVSIHIVDRELKTHVARKDKSTADANVTLESNGTDSEIGSATRLRVKPDVIHFYRTPGCFRYNRRRTGLAPAVDYFELLHIPAEIIVSIFTYLNKTDLVSAIKTCKRFHEAGYKSVLWEFIDLGDKALTELNIHSVLNRGVKVLRLTKATIKRNMVPRTDSVFLYPDAIPSKLTHIDLSMAIYGEPSIVAGIIQRCSHLEGISFENNAVDECICVAIGRNSNLEYLNMTMCEGINPEGLRAIIEGCRNLNEVNFGWAHFTSEHVKIVCQMLPPTTQRLNMSGVTGRGDLTDSDIADLVQSCPDLVELDLSDAVSITELSLRTILGNLIGLKDLSISRCYGIEPMALIMISGIQSLNIYGNLTDEGLELLRNRLKPVLINENPFSNIARPTKGMHKTSIWEHRTRDLY